MLETTTATTTKTTMTILTIFESVDDNIIQISFQINRIVQISPSIVTIAEEPCGIKVLGILKVKNSNYSRFHFFNICFKLKIKLKSMFNV